ncbi:MAG: PaaI family thioesterase [Pseudomonadota bacterium]|nr:PaaI family thioesterase [Pseudomonadota bacterium]
MEREFPRTLKDFNRYGEGFLFEHLGMVFTRVEATEVIAHIELQQHHSGWRDYLHTGTLFTLADSCAGYGCVKSLPESAAGFTTVEAKINFLTTVREGLIECTAQPLHTGRRTQVWDAEVVAKSSGKVLCSYRCTQIIL